MSSPDKWDDHELLGALRRERAALSLVTEKFGRLDAKTDETRELIDLVEEDEDEDALALLEADLAAAEKEIAALRLEQFFSHPDAQKECFIDIQAGSGGTEAQDWANMLRRMYVQYCNTHGFDVEILEETPGEVAGIKSAVLRVKGVRPYGNLRTETGIHRLVRKSPFDSNHKRHTSFASVFVYPVVDENFEVEVSDKDLRFDTYRASGAGGQHVNTTDSAVRITHLPTGIVVQCQSDRSQHRNKADAMSMLRSRLYQVELERRNEEKNRLEKGKSDISWGHQIRSYILDQARVKDLRTGHERGDHQRVLDGDIQDFIDVALQAGH